MKNSTTGTGGSSMVGQPILVILLCFLLVAGGLSQPAWAQTGNAVADAGLGVASFLATIPYGALKLAYAGLGAVVGGLTYVLAGGDLNAAEVVWSRAVLGTYVLTPNHLVGNEPIRFIGP